MTTVSRRPLLYTYSQKHAQYFFIHFGQTIEADKRNRWMETLLDGRVPQALKPF